MGLLKRRGQYETLGQEEREVGSYSPSCLSVGWRVDSIAFFHPRP